jgi:hypothetical protein
MLFMAKASDKLPPPWTKLASKEMLHGVASFDTDGKNAVEKK